MAFLPPVYTLLQASAAVTSIVGTKVFRHGLAPLGTVPPYVTWFVIASDPQNHLSGVPTEDMQSVQVDAWHAGDTGVVTLAEAVRDAIEPAAQMVGIVADLREEDTNLYHIGQQFDFWLSR